MQPASGHRSGIDAMMLAAALPDGFSGHVADLGAGAGAAGLAVLSRCCMAQASLFERDPVMLAAASATLALAHNAHLARRATIHAADVAARGRQRTEQGLPDDTFDAVIFNPPYNSDRDRATPDGRKAEAHVGHSSLLGEWLRTACAIAKPRGWVALIARPESLGDILSATGNRLGAMEVKPIHAHADAAAIRIVVRGIKGSRAKLRLAPPHVLHVGPSSGGMQPYTDAANRITNGEAALFE